MKKKTLHVVSSPSRKGIVRMGLGKLDFYPEIIYLPIDFSFGYIPKDFSDKELCFALASHNYIEVFEELKKFVTTDYSQYEKVIVWHGWSAHELFLLYLMSILVEGTLYHVDIRDCKGFMEKHLSKYPSRSYPDMGYVSPHDIYTYDMLSLAKPLNNDEKFDCRVQWSGWLKTSSYYRFSSIYNGVIEEYPENCMDDSIIKSMQKYSILSRVVGNVMMAYDHLFIPDSIIMRRIYQLRYNGEIELYCREKGRTSNKLTKSLPQDG